MFRIAMMAALGWRFGNFVSDVANAATRRLIDLYEDQKTSGKTPGEYCRDVIENIGKPKEQHDEPFIGFHSTTIK